MNEKELGRKLGASMRGARDATHAISLMALSTMGIEVPPEELATAQNAVLDSAEVEVETEPTGEWKANEWVSEGDKRTHEGATYECRLRHYTQAHYPPNLIPALWVVKGGGSGTKDEPITAAVGMEYQYGLYYLDPEDGKLYLCSRSGAEEGSTVVLQYLPHSLVGHYFVLAG